MTTPPRVLIVDSDPSSLGLLTHGMNRFGLAAESARDADQAVSLLSSNRPDVVVSDMDAGSGLQLLERIRQNPETRDLPVLLLAKGPWARRRTQARELGAQELVAKPAYVQDIAVLTWLYAGHAANEEWFEGSFGEPSCAALLRGLLAGGRSGTLRLEPSNAIVRFQDGSVVDAVLPPLTGERALLRILTLGTGSYELTFGPLPIKPTMQFELADLASRGVAHVRRWEQLQGEIQPLEQVLTVDFEHLASRVNGLPRGLFSLIRLFDGKRSIADVIAASALDDLTAGQAIAKLRSLDIFEQGRRAKWDADTPSLGRPTPTEPTDESHELPPFASFDSANEPPVVMQLTPHLSTSEAEQEFFSAPVEASIETAFFSAPVDATADLIRSDEPSSGTNPLRVVGWALVGAALIAVVVLFWQSTGRPDPATPPAVAAASAAVVPAPKVEAAPVAPTGLSDAAKKFDHLMGEGAVAYDKENFKGALDSFEQARALLPEESSAALAVGSTQYELGKLDLAAAELQKTVELDPQNGRAEILLGAIAQERGQKDLARDHYRNYLSIDPDGEHVAEVKALLDGLGE